MIGEWIKNPTTAEGFLCKIGLHRPGKWVKGIAPNYYASATLVIRRRWCKKCKAMQYEELEVHV